MTGVLIILIVFSFVAVIVKVALDHESEKKRLSQGQAADSSLKMSELKSLIREAIEEANEPIADRLSSLENRLEGKDAANLLPPAQEEGQQQTDE